MNRGQTGFNQGVKMFFGIFMVLVYLGMAYLMVINYFHWNGIRWVFAVAFGAYGLYRGYREIRGEHTYGMRTYNQEDEDARFTTYADRLKKQEEENEKK